MDLMLQLCGDIEENPSLVVDGCDRVNVGSSQNGGSNEFASK